MGRLCALGSEEAATTVHLWPFDVATDLDLQTTTAWATAVALGGTVEWPAWEYARTGGGWLIRCEVFPGQFGYDFVPDPEQAAT